MLADKINAQTIIAEEESILFCIYQKFILIKADFYNILSKTNNSFQLVKLNSFAELCWCKNKNLSLFTWMIVKNLLGLSNDLIYVKIFIDYLKIKMIC